MKLCALLSWFDESPSWLANVVCGFGRICDHVVAVDGAYQLYPGARPRSHPDQAEAIMAAAETMGIGCVIHRPQSIFWGNEVEKRNLTLKLAAPFLTPGDDFVVVADADTQVMLLEDPAYTRSLIAGSDKNVLTYTIFDAMDPMKGDEHMQAYVQKESIDTEWTSKLRGVYRWTPSLRYGPSHYCVRGTYDGDEEWLRGPDMWPGEAHKASEADDLGRNLVVVHRNERRAKVRRDAATGYYQMRDETGIETISQETLYAA